MLRTIPASIPVLLFCLCSCSSETLYQRNYELLDASLKDLDEARYKTCVSRMERLIVDTKEEASQYELQRFMAAYVAAQAHLRAAGGGSFLSDGPEGDAVHLEEAALGNDFSDEPSVAHLVASMYYMSHADEWYRQNAPLKADGVELVPRALDPHNAWLNLKLSEIAAYSQLGFWGRVDKLVREVKGLTDLRLCRNSLEQCLVLPGLWPSVYFAIYHVLRDEQPSVAYQFAIESIHGKNSAADARREERMEAIGRWMRSGTKMKWYCIHCDDKEAVIESRTCPSCDQVETINFYMQRQK